MSWLAVLKVLHVNDYAWAGGCEVLMNDTVAGLNERGIEAEIFTADEIAGFRRTPLSYIDSYRCRRALRERLKNFEPDIVHLHNFYHELSPGILAVLMKWRLSHRCRVVMTAHDYHLICPNSGLLFADEAGPTLANPEALRQWLYILTKRWDVRGRLYSALKVMQHLWNYRLLHRDRVIDLVICPSQYLQDLFWSFRTVHLPNPAPDPIVTQTRSRDVLRLVYAGRIEPEKGLESFLCHLPSGFDSEFEIVGDGTSLPRCEAICRSRRLDDRVTFVGQLPHAEARDRIARAHVLVLPSICPENYPLCLLEALSCDVNLLVTRLGGMEEVVRSSGVGFTFTHDRSDSLEDALRDIAMQHANGALNEFDATEFLQARQTERYMDGLLEAYEQSEKGDLS